MDFDIPSPSQFPSPSQWVNACTRPAFTDMSADMDSDHVRWIGSQWHDPAIQQLMAASPTEEERERRPCSSGSAYTPTWMQSASASANSAIRTASLPTFSATSSSTLPTTSTATSTSARKLPQRKPLSRKTPPSRAHLSVARTKDDRHVDSDRSEERLLDLMGSASRKADRNSLLKQRRNEKAEKKLTHGTSGDTVAWMNTVSASLSGSRFISAASNTGHLQEKTTTSTVPRASARSLGSSMSESLSSTILKPTIKLSRDSGTGVDVEMTTDSDRDTDLEGSLFTDSPGNSRVADALNKSFSMNVDDISLPSTKRTLGRVHSAGTVSSPTCSTISPSTSGLLSSKAIAIAPSTLAVSSEKTSQTIHVRPPALPSTTQRPPPPLGMRRPPNLPNTGFTSSQSRYATTQSSYAVSQAKGQKQAIPRPFKPPLLSKPNPKTVSTSKQIIQKPESPPTSTPELEMDDGDGDDDGGAAVADSSFDVSFEVDRDALEAAMRQYD